MTQSVAIPAEIEDVIKMVTKAHDDTFLAEPKNPSFSVVSSTYVSLEDCNHIGKKKEIK